MLPAKSLGIGFNPLFMKIIQSSPLVLLSVFCCFGTIANAAPPLVNASPAAANKITLDIAGIKEKTEALSIQLGAENTSSGVRDGSSADKAIVKDLVITRRVDAISKILLNKLLAGDPFDKITLTQGSLKIECPKAVVVDYQIDAESGQNGYQVETIILRVPAVQLTVAP